MQALIIPFNDLDAVKSVINLLRRQKHTFEIQEFQPSEDKSQEAFFAKLKESVEEIRAIQRGEKPHGQSLDDFLKEVRAELAAEKNVLQNAH